MWEVIIGGFIAIVGGFLSTLFTNHIDRKQQSRTKTLEAYEEIAKCLFEIDKAIADFDSKQGTLSIDLFLIKTELYTSVDIRSLVKEYNDVINRIFSREAPIEPLIVKKDELKNKILDSIRKSINKKNGGQI